LYGRHRQQIMAKGDFWTDDSPAPFFAQLVEVEVDTETGQVRVTRAINALDLGKAGNAATSALGWNTNLAAKAAAEGVEKVFNLGMSLEWRLGIDIGLTLAETVGCAINR